MALVGKQPYLHAPQPYWATPSRITYGFQFGTALENGIPHDVSHINMFFAEPSIGYIAWNSPHSRLPVRRFEVVGQGLFGASGHPGGDLFGGALDFRFDFVPLGHFVPYFDAGSGPVHTTINKNAEEITGQTQFLSQGGTGLQYFFDPQRAMVIEYHYFHMSNAGLAPPNRGFNGSMLTIGFRWLHRPHPMSMGQLHRDRFHLPHFW